MTSFVQHKNFRISKQKWFGKVEKTILYPVLFGYVFFLHPLENEQ